jgi:hypothetical protein
MRKTKVAIAKPRRAKPEKPEIFVRTREERWPRFAHASIRVKAGKYLYLVWRDGGRIRNFYLGQKRIS